MENIQECWTFASAQYVRASIENVEEYLGKKGQKLSAKALTTITSQYRPEVDISKELGNDEASYYHSLIGFIRWIVELGRAGICCEL